MTSTDSWFRHSLKTNNFAHAKTLAKAIEYADLDVSLISSIPCDKNSCFQIVSRSKHDRTFRPGVHVNPLMTIGDFWMADYLEDAYWTYSSNFDRREVFYFLLNDPKSQERIGGSLCPEWTELYNDFQRAVEQMANLYGGWVGLGKLISLIFMKLSTENLSTDCWVGVD